MQSSVKFQFNILEQKFNFQNINQDYEGVSLLHTLTTSKKDQAGRYLCKYVYHIHKLHFHNDINMNIKKNITVLRKNLRTQNKKEKKMGLKI